MGKASATTTTAANSATARCQQFLAGCDGFHLTEIYNRLAYERLVRKHDDIVSTFYRGGESWNQTLFVTFLRFLGAPDNSNAFETLAQRVGFPNAVRYMNSAADLEALLIGTSGLLELYRNDIYVLDLKRRFAEMARKHHIEPMLAQQWRTNNIYPHNHPIIRLAQAAAFFAQRGIEIKSVTACASPQQAEQLFDVTASDYWLEHFIPSQTSAPRAKRIGKSKAHILAINVVVPLKFAYGHYTERYELCDEATNLLEDLPPEDNFKIRQWKQCGIKPCNAYESQALIQLTNEYCGRQRCHDCPVGLRVEAKEKAAR